MRRCVRPGEGRQLLDAGSVFVFRLLFKEIIMKLSITEERAGSDFHTWKQALYCSGERRTDLEHWLFLRVSGVLFGGKPGELIIIKPINWGLPMECVLCHAGTFSSAWGLRYKALAVSGESVKLIIYKEKSVERRLKQASRKILHTALKYPVGLTPQSFLHEVSMRWQASGEIPHEIGIALGYPLKDVWGFMGLRRCRCSGSCGWQIFGDPKPSWRVRNRYLKARSMAERLLEAA